MRKLLVGLVAVASAVGGVSACGSKTTAKTPVGQTADVPVKSVENVERVKNVENTRKNIETIADAAKAPRFALVLNEGKSGFKFRSVTLSDEAKGKIDEMFSGDKVDLNNARFEIEGYTDNLGSKELNHQVGLARAKAVKQYLGEQYEIPSDWITVVSYGMEKPVADNLAEAQTLAPLVRSD